MKKLISILIGIASVVGVQAQDMKALFVSMPDSIQRYSNLPKCAGHFAPGIQKLRRDHTFQTFRRNYML